MKYLNLGCGYHYSTEPEWTNLDFFSTSSKVIEHNLLNGIPFENEGFDLVYHSHVLEHFQKEDGEKLIAECFRVLKPGGVIRIAVPDLEKITRNYIHYLEAGIVNPNDKMVALNYEWTLLEMYDQTVRNFTGGNMAKYLSQETIKNEKFVYERLGEEAKLLRKHCTIRGKSANQLFQPTKTTSSIYVTRLKRKIKEYLFKRLAIDRKALEIGKFRLNGEIHQWMYDKFSLASLLKNKGGKNVQERDAFTSYAANWVAYGLDTDEDNVRKPDSLFMEAVK